MMVRRTWWNLLLALLIPAGLPAAMELAPAPAVIKWNGFLTSWIDSGENAKSEYKLGGTLLKRLRLKLTAEAYDGVTLVALPEVAGGFNLLDGYVAFDLSRFPQPTNWPLTVTAGQFKTPFGQNRMYVPPALYAVDYSSISNALFNNNGALSFWDMGVMAVYKDPLFKVEAAAVGGAGPDSASPGGSVYGIKANAADFCGRVEVYPLGPELTLGGSVYEGTYYKLSATAAGGSLPLFPDTRLWTGAHLKWKPIGKWVEVEGEMINRGQDRIGYTGQPSYWVTDEIQLLAFYDRVVDYASLKACTGRVGGGINWVPSGSPVRLSLDVFGDSTGPSESPTSTKQVLQTQVTF